MIDKPSEEWTAEDWERLHRAAYEMSDRLMEVVEAQGDGDTFSPQVAGFALIIAMGRISGRYGFRSIPAEVAWKLWSDGNAEKQFRVAFESERQGERSRVN